MEIHANEGLEKTTSIERMDGSSDAYMGRIHRWAPLDETPGLGRWHWVLWESGPRGLSSVMGAHGGEGVGRGGLRIVTTKAQGPG